MKKFSISVLFLAYSLQSVYCQGTGISSSATISNSIDARDFNPSTLLWYKSPASVWEEALPVGNGRLGAMVFGKNGEERIQLNEETYWSGGPYSTVVKGGYKVLPEIQKLLFEGNPLKAHKLFGRYLMGYPVEQQKYQAFANLILSFKNEKVVTDYKRWLDLSTGVNGVQYQANGVTYRREVFSSSPDQVIAVKITADKPGSISFTAELRGERNGAHSNYATDYFRMDGAGNDELVLTGKSADYLGVEGKIRYEARLKAVPEGGVMKRNDANLVIENANSVTLYFVAATNFINYKDVSGDHHAKVDKYLKGIEGKNFSDIRDAAVKDYKSFFDRVTLKLPSTQNSFLPTDERLKKFSNESDPQLASLCYQFGRYLLISSSRVGTQPANLQGIWNKDMNPSWDSKYTTNINTQMNYWPAEAANLSELTEPLVTLVKEVTDQGAQVAKEHYGARGWVLHQNTDIWRVAAPMDGPTWGTFTVGGAWLTTHLWEHYLFTLNKDFLKEVYPVMKGSVEFFMDFLVEHPNGKWLVTNPSTSPENPPKGPGYSYFFDEVTSMYYFTTICIGSAMDMEILTDLFGYYAEASKILGVDQDFAAKVAKARTRLVPPQIGSNGSLQEWADDLEQMEDKHRHFSHLYGIYPGNVISAKRTPELVDPVKKVLEQRGDGGTGFSRAWKMGIWARLYDGNRANSIFKGYIKDQCYPSLFAKCFTPLQVDGSFGVTAGISEMLILSHEEAIELLPALPDEWETGSFSGVCARGAFELNFSWKNKLLTEAKLLSKAGQFCRIKAGALNRVTNNGKTVKITKFPDGSIGFATKPGNVYVFSKI
jgi:alpha-L-fucosidase 2